MTIEERLGRVERKLESLDAAIRAQPDAIREQIRDAFHRHEGEGKITVLVSGACDERIRQVAAANIGSALHDYNSRRG